MQREYPFENVSLESAPSGVPLHEACVYVHVSERQHQLKEARMRSVEMQAAARISKRRVQSRLAQLIFTSEQGRVTYQR